MEQQQISLKKQKALDKVKRANRVPTDGFFLQIYFRGLAGYPSSCPKIHLATEEDRAYNTDEWAMLFKAKNWEKRWNCAG
ncbi:MAG: hypothetical protein J5943_10525 [Oribacterium sp.]|nr:hypothetical protein [Oribacterium sp.]